MFYIDIFNPYLSCVCVQVNFDLYSKLLMVVGSCWLFQTLALLDIPALYYIGMVFAIIQGKILQLILSSFTEICLK